MTSKTFPKKIRALSYFTFPDAGVSGELVRPGDVLDVTEHAYARTLDAQGASWVTLTTEEQIEKYGSPRFEVIEENES